MTAYTNNMITDLLFKKVAYGVTETKANNLTGGKEAPGEALSSLLPVYANRQVWSQSDLITIPAATASTNNPTVVVDHVTTAVQLIQDPTVVSPNRTWLALKNGSAVPLTADSNRWINWINPSSFDPSYSVKLFKNNPAVSANELFWNTSGYEWFFDYSAGVLYFCNEGGSPVPSFSTLWLTGYTYGGGLGLTGSGGAAKSTSVATYPTMIAQTGMNSGDTTFVVDASGDPNNAIYSGVYAFYRYNGSSYDLIATGESAQADMTSFSFDLNALVNSSGTAFSIGTNNRVTGVDVYTSAPLNGTPSLIVGDAGNTSRLLNSSIQVDFSISDLFQNQLNYRYNTGTNVTFAYDKGGNTNAGTITVTVFLSQ